MLRYVLSRLRQFWGTLWLVASMDSKQFLNGSPFKINCMLLIALSPSKAPKCDGILGGLNVKSCLYRSSRSTTLTTAMFGQLPPLLSSMKLTPGIGDSRPAVPFQISMNFSQSKSSQYCLASERLLRSSLFSTCLNVGASSGVKWKNPSFVTVLVIWKVLKYFCLACKNATLHY